MSVYTLADEEGRQEGKPVGTLAVLLVDRRTTAVEKMNSKIKM